MSGEVLNIKVCSPLKLHSGLTGKYHAICNYSYNLPLEHIGTKKKWYFAIVDVVEILAKSQRTRKYWNYLKKKLTSEGYIEVSKKNRTVENDGKRW